MRKGTGLVVALFLLAPLAAAAFVRTPITIDQRPQPGTCLYWGSREIPWSLAKMPDGTTPPDAIVDATRRSFAEWTGPACSDLAFVEQGVAPRDVGYVEGGTNRNVVVFRDRACEEVVDQDDPCWMDRSCGARHDCWDFSRRMIAVTITTFVQCTGRVVDADIEMNGAHFEFTTGDGPSCRKEQTPDCVDTDVRNTLVHEIGHLIGLDHSPVTEATMFAQAERGEIVKRDLHEDDRAGLCHIYPAGGAVRTCGPASDAVCGAEVQGRSGGCGAAGGGFAFPGLVATLAWARWRLRRRGGGAGEAVAVAGPGGVRPDRGAGGGGRV